MATHGATAQAPFGPLDYRVFHPDGFAGATHLIHVSRGGNGLGDDRVALPAYVDALVREGYVVLSINHRFAGNNVERIAELRGEEIQFMAGEDARGGLATAPSPAASRRSIRASSAIPAVAWKG